jgi:hypothetical protein
VADCLWKDSQPNEEMMMMSPEHTHPKRAAQGNLAHAAWRRLPLADLETEILAVRRMATRQHFSPAEWKTVDRMRKRAHALRKVTS